LLSCNNLPTLKESEALEMSLQLQFAEKKMSSYEAHIESLNGGIKRLEEDLVASTKVINGTMQQLLLSVYTF
jgi:peptidoglycan hydrolase CwlO-like protein